VIDPLSVSELFYSIQGESTWAGFPCVFIRLNGCNLRCRYCDASYTWEEPGTEKTISDILEWVRDYPRVLTEITGGEPLLQDNIYPLTEQLIARGHKVLIETNGTISLEHVPLTASIIMDIKCPESGMDNKVHEPNIEMLARRKAQHSRDEIKFVLSSVQDFHWARNYVKKYTLNEIVPVLFSPVTGLLEPGLLAELLLTHQVPVRLQLQLHTLLWPDKSRGV
jgi:7-carboxy-7-deazaguanine synthase